MPELRIEPVEPIPDYGQPSLVVEYTCIRCGTRCRKELAKPGFLPRYCDDCLPLVASERVKRWRERHPEKAKAAAKKQNDKRPRKGTRQPAARNNVNDASLTSKKKPADLTSEEWQTLRRAASFIMESGGACYLQGVIKERSGDGLVMEFPYRHVIESLIQKNYLAGVKARRFKSSTNPQGSAQVLTNKASAVLGLPTTVEPSNA